MIKIKNPVQSSSKPKKPKKKNSQPPKTKKQSERLIPDINMFSLLHGLTGLRLTVLAIFICMTISFILALTSEFAFSVGLIILSYIGLLALLIKLFLVKYI